MLIAQMFSDSAVIGPSAPGVYGGVFISGGDPIASGLVTNQVPPPATIAWLGIQ
jgi:hypothetical protein